MNIGKTILQILAIFEAILRGVALRGSYEFENVNNDVKRVDSVEARSSQGHTRMLPDAKPLDEVLQIDDSSLFRDYVCLGLGPVPITALQAPEIVNGILFGTYTYQGSENAKLGSITSGACKEEVIGYDILSVDVVCNVNNQQAAPPCHYTIELRFGFATPSFPGSFTVTSIGAGPQPIPAVADDFVGEINLQFSNNISEFQKFQLYLSNGTTPSGCPCGF